MPGCFGCHCGRVRFRARVDLDLLSQCSCSISTKTGILHLPIAIEDFQLLRGKNALTVYTFGTGVVQHTFCSHCGICAFYLPRSQLDRITVNARCLDSIDGPSLSPSASSTDGTGKRHNVWAPEHGRATLIPEGWFEQWADFTLAEDPSSRGRALDRLRATNGPIQDIRDYWAVGRKYRYYDPSDIRVPVLLVHGEWGVDVPIDLAQAFFLQLSQAPYRKWVEIGEATHLVLLEKNWLLAFEAIRDFYQYHFAPETAR